MNDWNYDASCTLTSLPVWDLFCCTECTCIMAGISVSTDTQDVTVPKWWFIWYHVLSLRCMVLFNYWKLKVTNQEVISE
jgi:hypothetical protein